MTATLGIKLEKREREWRDTFEFGRIGGGEYGNPVQWKLPGVYEGGLHENSQ